MDHVAAKLMSRFAPAGRPVRKTLLLAGVYALLALGLLAIFQADHITLPTPPNGGSVFSLLYALLGAPFVETLILCLALIIARVIFEIVKPGATNPISDPVFWFVC